MTKPEDIPQWAWEKAREGIPPVYFKMEGMSPTLHVLRLGIAKAILSAVEEEREACAKLADVGQWEHRPGQTWGSPATAVFVGKIGPEIAKDIRNRKES